MKTLYTEIIINASPEKVWNILIDFESYSEWNPFVLSIEGKPEVGTKLKVVLKNGNGTSVFKPNIVSVKVNSAFAWIGSLPLGIFNGHHQFRIEKLNDKEVKFIQIEEFSGLLANILLKLIGEATKQSFMAMNEALKSKAEK